MKLNFPGVMNELLILSIKATSGSACVTDKLASHHTSLRLTSHCTGDSIRIEAAKIARTSASVGRCEPEA